MLSFDEALARILGLASAPAPTEVVDLEDAYGRVLGQDLIATADLPGFDYSSMDGYAVRLGEGSFPVIGESKTGVVPSALAPNSTMRIFTGAEVPAGAEAVVMQEEVTREGDTATFSKPPRPGQNIRRRGEDLAKGGVAIAKGTRLSSPHLALAASLDCASLSVARRPSVAIIATGDELRKPGTDAKPGTIAESNTVALRAMARRAGAIATALPYVPDDKEATEKAFAAALDAHDVVITIGGVSVGDHDLVRPALEAVGVTLDFWKVAIKPGKPLAVGRKGNALVLGLPGNPASAMVTFGLFGVPLLRALQGDRAPVVARRRATLVRAHAHSPGRTEFARATLSGDSVTTFGNQSSGAITSMAREGAALVVVPAESDGLAAGTVVEVIALADLC